MPTLRTAVRPLEVLYADGERVTERILYWAASFMHSYVRDELMAQRIAFPAASSPAITSLPASDAQAMKQYAGQELDSGDQALTYANHFIAVHLREIGGGKTHSQVSATSLAAPTNAKLAALTQTLFRGETLRGLLLNAWGWWTVGSYALWAAIILTLAAITAAGNVTSSRNLPPLTPRCAVHRLIRRMAGAVAVPLRRITVLCGESLA